MQLRGQSVGTKRSQERGPVSYYRVKSFHTSSGNKYFPRCTGTVEEKFWSKVSPEPNTGCWLWGGDTNGKYASIGVHKNKKTVRIYAHRLSYEMFIGPIPDGLEIDHKCRMKMCVNPEHLRAVTPRENMMLIPSGMRGNNQIKDHCKRGHPFVGSNLRFDPTGHAVCRACSKMHAKNFLDRKLNASA